jgi:phage-related protein
VTYTLQYFNPKLQAQIESWPSSILASFVRISVQMQLSGPHLGLPYTKALGQGLFEVRAKGTEGIGRVFFCCLKGQRVIFLHGFIKKTQNTPLKEIRIAKKRMQEAHDEKNS